jgi:hypothetical protein
MSWSDAQGGALAPRTSEQASPDGRLREIRGLHRRSRPAASAARRRRWFGGDAGRTGGRFAQSGHSARVGSRDALRRRASRRALALRHGGVDAARTGRGLGAERRIAGLGLRGGDLRHPSERNDRDGSSDKHFHGTPTSAVGDRSLRVPISLSLGYRGGNHLTPTGPREARCDDGQRVIRANETGASVESSAMRRLFVRLCLKLTL